MTTSRVRRQIKVLLFETGVGGVVGAVVSSEWQGPRRVDWRLSRSAPVQVGDSRPRGVSPEVWWAKCAIDALVLEQQARLGEVTGH